MPRLILELREGEKTINFHEINLLSAENMKIKPPTEGKKLQEKSLLTYRLNFLLNIKVMYQTRSIEFSSLFLKGRTISLAALS